MGEASVAEAQVSMAQAQAYAKELAKLKRVRTRQEAPQPTRLEREPCTGRLRALMRRAPPEPLQHPQRPEPSRSMSSRRLQWPIFANVRRLSNRS